MNIAEVTCPVRHKIVRMVAPRLYETTIQDHQWHPTARASTCFVKMKMPQKRVSVVEVGVYQGVNAENIIKTLDVDILFAVDPYVPYTERGRDWYSPFFGISAETAKLEAAKRLAPFGEKVKFIYETSERASLTVPDDQGFVYVDGAHGYEFVRKDIELWYPKLSPDGIIGGHDFSNKYPGVIKAVTEFAVKSDLQLMVDSGDWWLVNRHRPLWRSSMVN